MVKLYTAKAIEFRKFDLKHEGQEAVTCCEFYHVSSFVNVHISALSKFHKVTVLCLTVWST